MDNMKHGIYGILAVLLALLLAFQLPMTSFAAAEEAAPEEEAEEDEDEDELFDEDEEDEEDDIYYVIYNMDGFSFDVNWDWSRKTEKLDYGTHTIFSTEDGFPSM